MAAVGAHVRLQLQLRAHPLQRRHILYRRGPADAAGIATTVKNLREIAPTIFFNVPKGFEELLPYLRPTRTCGKPSSRACGCSSTPARACRSRSSTPIANSPAPNSAPMPWTTSLGSTETGARRHHQRAGLSRPGIVGVPHRGVELKLVPNAGKLEARLRGPNIMPGYWRRPDLNAAAFDEEGFYKIGDALKTRRARQLGGGLRVRRPRLRGFQARDRNLGQRRPAADRVPQPFRAARAGRRHRRPRPRRHRRAGVSRRIRRALAPICAAAFRRGGGARERVKRRSASG